MRPITPVSMRQNIRVRHLEPPELPTPNPIIVKERQLTPPPPAPPVYIRQYQPAPPTPPPLVIRERPPVAPRMPETTYIEKIIPPPSPPPRQVVIERIPAPEKPRDIVYEVKIVSFLERWAIMIVKRFHIEKYLSEIFFILNWCD